MANPDDKPRSNGSYRHPPAKLVATLRQALAPWQLWASPRYYGLERLPEEKPLWFVGNHTLMAAYDVPFLVLALWDRYGQMVRGLSDQFHFKVPVWREFLSYWGWVKSCRESAEQLLREGELILNFPGGGREVAKNAEDLYLLHWKDRSGFARIAVEHGCTLVPFSMVGADDAWDIRLDAARVLASPVGPLLRRLGVPRDMLLPVVSGVGPTIIPRPDRLYFHIAEPIPTAHLQHRANDEAVIFEVREQVREAVEGGLTFLLSERRRDPGRTLLGRLRTGQWAGWGLARGPK